VDTGWASLARHWPSRAREIITVDIVSLSGHLQGDRALEQLLAASVAQDPDSELCLNAVAVDAIDVAAATAARMRIERHMRMYPQGTVTMWLPSSAPVAARFYDILSPPRDRLWVERPPGRRPRHFALLPATPVADSESARLTGEVALDACLEARIAPPRARYIAAATMELADNAVVHAEGAEDPAIVAVSSVGRERTVEIAVTDAGRAISEAPDPAAILSEIPGRAIAGHPGFLGLILARGRDAGVDVSVWMAAGTGRLRWTRTQHRTERKLYVPGTTVIARVGA
jgi:anti-sigma regulatory factor (Ser/Thr protein kinase)